MAKQPSSSSKADDQLIVIKTMLNSSKAAKHMAKTLVKERLAACAQVVPRITSYYHWEGKLCCTREYMVLAKTMQRRYLEIQSRILELHGYESPEILRFEAEASEGYLAWVSTEV